MSRSRKKSPFHGIAKARSDQPFKHEEHQRRRSAERDQLHKDIEGVMPDDRQFGDPWSSPKDGKRYAPDWNRVRRK